MQQWIDKSFVGEGAYAPTYFIVGFLQIGIVVFYIYILLSYTGNTTIFIDVISVTFCLIFLMFGVGNIIVTLDMRSIARVIEWDGSKFDIIYFFRGGASFYPNEIKSITRFQLAGGKKYLTSLSPNVTHYLISLSDNVSFRIPGDIEGIPDLIETIEAEC